MNLFEIDANCRALLNAMISEAEENDGIVSDYYMEALEILNDEKEKKIENITLYIKELKADAEALKYESKKLAERARIAENQADRLKEYISEILKIEGVEKFKTSRVSLSFRKSSSVVVDDLEQIPVEFIKIEKSAMKTELKKALADGSVAGAHIEEHSSLIIK